MHLVGYLYEDYHDAWPLEHKVKHRTLMMMMMMTTTTMMIKLYSWVCCFDILKVL